MPSESVWIEQVDTAFIAFIQGIVKLQNADSILVPIPVDIQKPDEDFKIEQYPCGTLYNLYDNYDPVRYDPTPVIVSRDNASHSMVVEKSALPYSLFYQLNFWSRTQTEMNEMTRLWFGNIEMGYFNLPVKDLSGNDRSCFCRQIDNVNKFEYLVDTERTLHTVVTYRIWVELDEKSQTTQPMVSSPQSSVSNQ